MVTQNMLRTHKAKYVFSGKNIRYVTNLDLILTRAPISKLPSGISNMTGILNYIYLLPFF